MLYIEFVLFGKAIGQCLSLAQNLAELQQRQADALQRAGAAEKQRKMLAASLADGDVERVAWIFCNTLQTFATLTVVPLDFGTCIGYMKCPTPRILRSIYGWIQGPNSTTVRYFMTLKLPRRKLVPTSHACSTLWRRLIGSPFQTFQDVG